MRDLQSIMLGCYVSVVSCFFGLSSYLTENSVTTIEISNCEILCVCLVHLVKCLLFLSDFNEDRKVSMNFRKNPKCEFSRKFVR